MPLLCFSRVSRIGVTDELAESEGLRGMDAVQLAAALLSGCDLFVAADRRLCQAARQVRLQVLDLDHVEE
jgi:predicted nucleic acid-binding protein